MADDNPDKANRADTHSAGFLDDRINLRGYFEKILSERDKIDLERNRRLDERFDAQEKAVQFALTEREKAVNAALIAAKEAVAAALTAAKEAVNKAEISSKETLEAHNGLISQMRERDQHFATRVDVSHISSEIGRMQAVQAKLVGALVLASVLLPIAVSALFVLTR